MATSTSAPQLAVPQALASARVLVSNAGKIKERTRDQITAAMAVGLDYPATQVGVVGNITVMYDTSLGAQGLSIAKQLLGAANRQYEDMQVFFGIKGGAVTVVVAPLSGSNDGSGAPTTTAATSPRAGRCTSMQRSPVRRSIR